MSVYFYFSEIHSLSSFNIEKCTILLNMVTCLIRFIILTVFIWSICCYNSNDRNFIVGENKGNPKQDRVTINRPPIVLYIKRVIIII